MSRPKKSLGQNFLMHARIAERIVAAAHLPPNATVLEIGPGTGMLTAPLIKSAKRVVAVETDGDLIPELQERFSGEIDSGALQLISGDIRTFDLSTVASTGEYHVVANIPYYITGEIIRLLLTAQHKPASVTLLVQKEVAERIARPHGKESLLSVSVAVYGVPKYCFTVPRGAFRPAPSVDSAVLTIQSIRQDAFEGAADEEAFFEMVRAGFAHKRKRLAKNLELVLRRESISEILTAAEVAEHARAEDVSVSSWRKMLAAARTSGALVRHS